MSADLTVTIDAWENGSPIPAPYAFCIPSEEGHVALSDNKNPAISWSGAPEGTKSFAVICHDSDVPSSGEDVNQEGKTVPTDLPRVDFYHWVVADVPASCATIEEAQDSDGITAKGKNPGQQSYGITGLNNYTEWFAGDENMGGEYAGYDGPCPPWNDSIVHHYHFTVYALDIETTGLSGSFGGPELLAAIEGHVLAKGSHVGTYSLNPDVPA